MRSVAAMSDEASDSLSAGPKPAAVPAALPAALLAVIPAGAASPCGLLVIDKPLGLTSMDVCRRVRWRLVQAGAPKRVKVGHGGTLDPLATGVLVVMVGKATRLCERVMAGQKAYETSVDLSAFSTTDDAEGERTAVTPDGGPPTRERVERVCAGFVGTIMQRPPAYSAIKLGGRRAYDMARAGEVVQIQARPVVVHAVRVCGYEYPSLTLSIDCGRGVYVRSLARDIGLALGTGGYLTALRRTRVGRWTIDQARTLAGMPEKLEQQDLLEVPGPE